MLFKTINTGPVISVYGLCIDILALVLYEEREECHSAKLNPNEKRFLASTTKINERRPKLSKH